MIGDKVLQYFEEKSRVANVQKMNRLGDTPTPDEIERVSAVKMLKYGKGG